MGNNGQDGITVIGPTARFKGELSFEGSGKILGTFEGSIDGSGELTVGAGAQCNATVQADKIVVDGAVTGDLLARERLHLTDKAHVQGDITAASLVVTEGATFVGRCAVGATAVQNATKERAAVEAKPRAIRDAWNVDQGEYATTNG